MDRYAGINRGLWDRPDRTRRQRTDFALDAVGRGRTVLDVGCAAGESGLVLGPGNFLVGLDVVEEYVRRLEEGYRGCITGSAVRLPFRSGSFDAVFAGELIEHLDSSDGLRFLGEARRVLKTGGVLALTTPNPSYWRTRLFGIRISGGPHQKVYQPRELEECLARVGLDVVRRRGLGRMAFLLGQRLPLVLYGDYGLVAEKRADASPGLPVDNRDHSGRVHPA